jgi:alpha-1,2-mannosyltransferase
MHLQARSQRGARLGIVALSGVIGLVAFAARLLPVLRGGGLGGVLAYDDGVYFGAAESFVFGRLPYRDFVLLHPPGILLVLAPFAELARWTTDVRGFAAARLAFMCFGALSAALVYLIARRTSPAAGVVGGLFYALWGPATYAERTTLLEPLVNLGMLVGLFCLGDLRTTTRRRALVGGAMLGLASTVKLWAVIPLVVLALWLLARSGPRRALAFVTGSFVATALVCLPFFVMAPGQMLRLVVLDQLGRTNNGVTSVRRLLSITDLQLSGGHVTTDAVIASMLLLGVVAVLSVWLAVTEPETRPWVSLLAAQTTVLLLSPSYFAHYATYVAPALALLVGAAAGLAFAAVRHVAVVLRAAAVLATAALLAGVGAVGQLHPEGRDGPGRAVQLAVSDARCVTGDTPASLIAADMLARDLRHACPLIVDVTGLTYTEDKGDLANGPTGWARRHDLEWQHRLARYLLHSDAVIVQSGNPDGLDRATLARLGRDSLTVRSPHFAVYERRPVLLSARTKGSPRS